MSFCTNSRKSKVKLAVFCHAIADPCPRYEIARLINIAQNSTGWWSKLSAAAAP
jgi:hypothetical protein